ncbi:MAG: TRAP transporter small permease subunit [Rhodospirillaceae bacterium]|nr:TRAP transporter small permease subunit [Rhodospirillaceae bacterium]
MRFLTGFIHGVDAVNEHIGRAVAWLTLGCVLTCFAVVVLRYGFNVGYPWLQEFYVWQHAAVFLVGAGYTFLHRGHVNVDIFYGRMPERRKAWLDIFSTLVFLFPWLGIVAATSSSFILSSWAIREPSSTADGMPALFLLKSALWVFCALVFVQGLALLARRAMYLAGYVIIDHDEDRVTDERV